MSLTYYIFLVICFLLFNKLKIFTQINKYIKIKDKTLLFGLHFTIFYIITSIIYNFIYNHFPLIEGQFNFPYQSSQSNNRTSTFNPFINIFTSTPSPYSSDGLSDEDESRPLHESRLPPSSPSRSSLRRTPPPSRSSLRRTPPPASPPPLRRTSPPPSAPAPAPSASEPAPPSAPDPPVQPINEDDCCYGDENDCQGQRHLVRNLNNCDYGMDDFTNDEKESECNKRWIIWNREGVKCNWNADNNTCSRNPPNDDVNTSCDIDLINIWESRTREWIERDENGNVVPGGCRGEWSPCDECGHKTFHIIDEGENGNCIWKENEKTTAGCSSWAPDPDQPGKRSPHAEWPDHCSERINDGECVLDPEFINNGIITDTYGTYSNRCRHKKTEASCSGNMNRNSVIPWNGIDATEDLMRNNTNCFLLPSLEECARMHDSPDDRPEWCWSNYDLFVTGENGGCPFCRWVTNEK